MFKRLISILLILIILIPSPRADAQVNRTITDTAWNADGTRLAVARIDDTLDIFDTSGQLMNTFQTDAYTYSLQTVDWNPAVENQVAIGGLLGAAFILDLDISNGQFINAQRIDDQLNSIQQVEFNSDGTYLAIEGEMEPQGSLSKIDYVQVWDTNTYQRINTYSDDWYSVTDMAWNPQNPNEMLIATIEIRGGNRLIHWNPITDMTIWTYDSEEDRSTQVAWSPNGTQFAVATVSADHAIFRVHNAMTGEIITTLPNIEKFNNGDVIWEPGNHLIIDSTKIHIWDTTSFEQIAVIDEFSSKLTLSPTGQLAYGKATGGDYSRLFTQDLNTVIPNYPSITSFTLVDADADEDLRRLEDGGTITEETITIRVETEPPIVGSVVFGLDDEPRFKVENEAAYALKGDDNGDYHAWLAEPGTYTLTATPYTEADGQGEAGTPLTITFTVAEPGS